VIGQIGDGIVGTPVGGGEDRVGVDVDRGGVYVDHVLGGWRLGDRRENREAAFLVDSVEIEQVFDSRAPITVSSRVVSNPRRESTSPTAPRAAS
jgi:hypothetical protein